MPTIKIVTVDTCIGCMEQKKIIGNLENNIYDKVNIEYVSIEDFKDEANELSIYITPTAVFYDKDNNYIKKIENIIYEDDINNYLDKLELCKNNTSGECI